MNKAPDALWNDCLKLIRDNVTEQQYDTWFKPIVFESFNTATKTVLVQVPSPFVYEYLEENYVDLLSKVLKRIYGASVQLSYRIVTDKAHDVTVDLLSDSAAQIAKPQPQTRGNQPPSVLDAQKPQDIDPQLNPRQTFDNFIEGDSLGIVYRPKTFLQSIQPHVHLWPLRLWKDASHQCHGGLCEAAFPAEQGALYQCAALPGAIYQCRTQ